MSRAQGCDCAGSRRWSLPSWCSTSSFPDLGAFGQQVRHHRLVLPMLALLHLLHKLDANEFCAAGDDPVRFGPQVKTLHEVVWFARGRILKQTVERGGANQIR